jgi:arsenate reductase-like glutaredoxin family protein
MKLYGTDSCTECKQARKLMEDMRCEFLYIDVAQIIGYRGQIPRLVSDDETNILGFGKIARYLRGIK